MRLVAVITSFVALLLTAIGASAHESRPLFVEITERTPNTFSVTWRIPPSALGITAPVVVMPTGCTAAAPPVGSDLVKQQLFNCLHDLSDTRISVDFPRYNPSMSTLFRLQRLSGEQQTTIKGPQESVWQVPGREETLSVAWDYMILGVEHILLGYDHLLFVACLVFIAGSWRRILVTVTGFTIAHSITLVLAALNLVRVPIPPVEAVIALSIVFLATEIVRNRRDTLTWRYPIAVAGSFGLLHGFGFASVLSEIGLPQTEIPAALLFFNVGVEIGQIAFVAVLLGAPKLAAVVRAELRSEAASPSHSLMPGFSRFAAYTAGTIASYWLIDRIAGFVA